MHPAPPSVTLLPMKITAAAERRIDAPASRLYRYIADFRQHHPNFLPPEFSDFVIEEGGVGAGTVHRFTLTLNGRASAGHFRVDEPEPGRVLTESDLTDPEAGMVTRFIVEPMRPDTSRVRIETEWQRSGLRGIVERMAAPRMLRRLYERELALLAEYARSDPMTEPRHGRIARGLVLT